MKGLLYKRKKKRRHRAQCKQGTVQRLRCEVLETSESDRSVEIQRIYWKRLVRISTCKHGRRYSTRRLKSERTSYSWRGEIVSKNCRNKKRGGGLKRKKITGQSE